MKNEVLVRAITGIDDELIVSAHRTERSARKLKMYFGTLAAGLLLICGVIFCLRRDDRPAIVFSIPTVSAQSIATFDLRHTSQTIITVTFDIEYDGALTIEADDGTVTLYSAETNEQIYVGRSCETKGSVKVEWTVNSPDISRNYFIKVNNKETVALMYDHTTEQWTTAETEE